MKKRVLFLCTHNSCRSQMAEGLVNHFLGDRFQAFSAGTEATRVNPLASEVMAELVSTSAVTVPRPWTNLPGSPSTTSSPCAATPMRSARCFSAG